MKYTKKASEAVKLIDFVIRWINFKLISGPISHPYIKYIPVTKTYNYNNDVNNYKFIIEMHTDMNMLKLVGSSW